MPTNNPINQRNIPTTLYTPKTTSHPDFDFGEGLGQQYYPHVRDLKQKIFDKIAQEKKNYSDRHNDLLHSHNSILQSLKNNNIDPSAHVSLNNLKISFAKGMHSLVRGRMQTLANLYHNVRNGQIEEKDIPQDLDKWLSSQGHPSADDYYKNAHQKMVNLHNFHTSPQDSGKERQLLDKLDNVPFKYKPPDNAQGINPDHAAGFARHISRPINPNHTPSASSYNGGEDDIKASEARFTNAHPFMEQGPVAQKLNTRAEAFDNKGIQVNKISRQPIRPSTNHAIRFTIGGGILPPGISDFLGKNNFHLRVVPAVKQRFNGTHSEINDFINNPRSRGSLYFHGHQGDKIGLIHESNEIETPKAHEDTVANTANVMGKAFYKEMFDKFRHSQTGEDGPRKALLGMEYAAKRLGFKDGMDLFGHLMRNYAMSNYAAAKESGDDQNLNVYGDRPLFDKKSQMMDRWHQTLQFLHNIDNQHPEEQGLGGMNLADSVYTLLKAAGGIDDEKHMQSVLEHGDLPFAQEAGPNVNMLREGKNQGMKAAFPETEEINKQYEVAAKNLPKSPVNIEFQGSKENHRPGVVYAVKKALATYSPGIQQLLKGMNIRFHGVDSPHPHLQEMAKGIPHSELPLSSEEKETGLTTTNLGPNNRREIDIGVPTQKLEHAQKEAVNKIEDQVGRQVFSALGGFNPNGAMPATAINGQPAPMGAFIDNAVKMAALIATQFSGKQFLGVNNAQEMINQSPEAKYLKHPGLNLQKDVGDKVGIASHIFNQLFKPLHEATKNETTHAGRLAAFNKFMNELPKKLTEQVMPDTDMPPAIDTIRRQRYGMLKREMLSRFYQLSSSFRNLLYPIYNQ